jgi:hypothetical protein
MRSLHRERKPQTQKPGDEPVFVVFRDILWGVSGRCLWGGLDMVAYIQQHAPAPQLHSMRLNRKCHACSGVSVIMDVTSYLNVNFRRQAGWEAGFPIQLAYFFAPHPDKSTHQGAINTLPRRRNCTLHMQAISKCESPGSRP